MQIQSNYINNVSLNQRHNAPEFKGKVSPDFIQYVEALKNDCLETVCQKKGITLAEYRSNPLPIPGTKSINNICKEIIKKANKVMEICFPPESELSVDTTTIEGVDALCISYSLIDGCKHNTGLITKSDKPLNRLFFLRDLIKGKYTCFSDAYGKDHKFIFSQLDYELNFKHMYVNVYKTDKEFFSKALGLLKFYRQHIDICESEGIVRDVKKKIKCFDRCISDITQYLKELESTSEQ